jgi:hypothetical protein
MMKRIFLIVAIVLMPMVAFGANTINYTDGVLTLTAIDTDWKWTDLFGGTEYKDGVYIYSITFTPGAQSDRGVFTHTGIDGPEIFNSGVAQNPGGWYIQYYPTNKKFKIYLDVSDGTYNAACKLTIIFANPIR